MKRLLHTVLKVFWTLYIAPFRMLFFRQGVFVSCCTREFEDKGGKHPGFRKILSQNIDREEFHARKQETIGQYKPVTLDKLHTILRGYDHCIHIVGGDPGTVVSPDEVNAFLSRDPDFFVRNPNLGLDRASAMHLTYTQWEAYIAHDLGLTLYCYACSEMSSSPLQVAHVERLKNVGRHTEVCKNNAQLHARPIIDLAKHKNPGIRIVIPLLTILLLILVAVVGYWHHVQRQKSLEEAWRVIDEFASDTAKANTMYCAAMGITPLRRPELDDTHRMLKPAVETAITVDDDRHNRPAKLLLARNFLRLYDGPTFPNHTATETKECYDRIVATHDDIVRARSLNSEPSLGLLFIQQQYTTALLSFSLAYHLKEFDAVSNAGLMVESKARITQAQQLASANKTEPMFQINDIGLQFSNLSAPDTVKKFIRDITSLMNKRPSSAILAPGAFLSKCHILRFKMLLQLAAKSPADFATVNAACGTGTPPSAFDESVEYFRKQETESLQAWLTITLWLDTLLADYISVIVDKPKLGVQVKQNLVEHLIYRQAEQSQRLLHQLSRSNELSPDYLYASILVTYYAVKMADDNQIPVELRLLMIKDVMRCCNMFIDDTDVLITPVRVGRTFDVHKDYARKMLDDMLKVQADLLSRNPWRRAWNASQQLFKTCKKCFIQIVAPQPG